jgi:protein-tyrosine phosphatase
MAEAIAKAELKRRHVAGVRVWSRGLAGAGWVETAKYAVEALGRLGIELPRRPSQVLTEKDLEAADLVLTMTSAQRERVAADWPDVCKNTFVISDFSGTLRGDVPDPVGRSEEDYDRCAERLKDEIVALVPKLRRTLRRRRPER